MVFVHVNRGEIVTMSAFGLADTEHSRPMTVTTPLRVGSISKPVTAALALELAADGVVDLDVSVDTYLEVDLTDGHGPAATIRQLLQHRGGYPDAVLASHHRNDNPLSLGRWATTVPDRVLDPNTVPSYSSVGYTLAGAALAEAAGSDFATVANHHLLEPLGMNGASFAQPPPDSVAVGHRLGPDGEMVPVPLDQAQLVPGAGLTAAAVDVAQFLAALTDPGSSLRPGTRAELLTVRADDDELRGISTGLTEWRYEQGSVLYHGGNGIGTTNRLMVLPAEGVGYFTAVNGAAITGTGDPTSQSAFVRNLHQRLIERFHPRIEPLARVSIDYHGGPEDEANGDMVDRLDGVYVPTRIDTGSVLGLEKLLAQRSVATTDDGVMFGESEYQAEPNARGVFRGDRGTIVFRAGSDGDLYATTGGTGSYRRIGFWERRSVNLAMLGAAVVLAIAGLFVGLRATRRRAGSAVRWLMAAAGTAPLTFLSALGYGMATVDVMDLFTGLPPTIRFAQLLAAATVVAGMALAVVLVHLRRRGGLDHAAGLALVSLVAADAVVGMWAWYWHALPM
jgi:CubicO group peptidase (beta-lactamase class C family)